MPFPLDCDRPLEELPVLRADDDEPFFAELFDADPELEDRELDADLPPELDLEPDDLPPDLDPDLEPPDVDLDELDERAPVLFFAVEDLLDDERPEDPPDDFAVGDFDADFDPPLEERDELDPDLDDLAAPDLDAPDFEDADLEDLEDPDLEDPELDDLDDPDFVDFAELDFDDDPDFEPVDFFVVGIFVSSGIYRCVFRLRNARVGANVVPTTKTR